jgi:transposase
LRFVEMKTEDELDMQTLHRSRERQLAWLGLVPRQSTTGGKPRLMGISKRGNKYLRKLLIHGARAALPYVAEKDTALGRWAKSLLGRVHQNVAVVAFANKLARTLGRTAKRPKVCRQGSASGGLTIGWAAHMRR